MTAPTLSALCAADAEIARTVDAVIEGCDRFERAFASLDFSPAAEARWAAAIARLRGEPAPNQTGAL